MTWREYVLQTAGPRAQVVMHPADCTALHRYLETIQVIIERTEPAELIHRDGIIDGRVQRSFFQFEGVPLFPSEHAEIGKPVLMEPVERSAT